MSDTKAGFDPKLLGGDNLPYHKNTQPEINYLPLMKWHTRMNRVYKFFGLDDPSTTRDYSHWASYDGPKIFYDFNSRGFRDIEWPQYEADAKNAIWIVGDSHTFGMGLAYKQLLKVLLEQKTGMRVIDVSIDATLPPHRARMAKRIVTELQPKYLVMQWGYIWRYKRKYRTLAQEVRAKIFEKQKEHIVPDFLKVFEKVNNFETETQIIHTFLPNFAGFDGKLQKKVFDQIEQYHNPNQTALFETCELDKSRDAWHMGAESHKWYADKINKMIQECQTK